MQRQRRGKSKPKPRTKGDFSEIAQCEPAGTNPIRTATFLQRRIRISAANTDISLDTDQNLIQNQIMKDLSATEAARSFSEVLDAVEDRRESFTIRRRGKAVAKLVPATEETGNFRAIRELFETSHVDKDFARDVMAARKTVRLDDPVEWSE